MNEYREGFIKGAKAFNDDANAKLIYNNYKRLGMSDIAEDWKMNWIKQHKFI